MKIESAVGLLQPRQHHSSCTLIKAGFTVLVTLVSGYSFQSRCLAADPSVPQNLLTNSTYGTILGFDLRDERAPKATVLIMKPTGALNATVDLALPFKIQEPTPNEEALVRVGTFEHWTLVTYSELPSQRWPQQVSFFPKPDFMPDPPPQNTDLRGSLYLHNMGQVWRFLYRYPDVNHRNTLPSGSSNLTLRQFDAIAVAIPENAKRLEVRGKTAIPEHIAANQFARFYPPAATAPSEPFLEIMYELPLTAKQAIVVEYGVKFLLALSPILGLLLLREEFSILACVEWPLSSRS